jgi:mono/diheme cytochrome c family protein
MHTIKVILFVFLVVGFYTFYSNSIPQMESHPPKKISLDANLTEDDMIEAGEKVYSTKGTCGICHGIGRKGSRGPDLNGVGLRAGKRVAGMSAKVYLIESMIKPTAYFVEGYGPMMPPMASILTPGEIMVIVAYLQSLGGQVNVTPDDIRAAMKNSGATVSAPAPSAEVSPSQTAAALPQTVSVPAQPGDFAKGEGVYKINCAACHNPTDSSKDGPIGPAIKGASRELLVARVMSGNYPPGYTPKRETKLMPPMVHLKDEIDNLTEFLK